MKLLSGVSIKQPQKFLAVKDKNEEITNIGGIWNVKKKRELYTKWLSNKNEQTLKDQRNYKDEKMGNQ